MNELTPLQKKIISSLIFTESFDHILEEVKETEPIVGAEIKLLIDRRFIQVMEEVGNNYKKSVFYDSDNMRAYLYRATEKGLSLYGDKRR